MLAALSQQIVAGLSQTAQLHDGIVPQPASRTTTHLVPLAQQVVVGLAPNLHRSPGALVEQPALPRRGCSRATEAPASLFWWGAQLRPLPPTCMQEYSCTEVDCGTSGL